MAYADPPTVAAAAVAPASLWNTYVLDNFKSLDRGISGVHSIGTGGGFGERYYPMFPVRTGTASATLATAAGTLYAVPLIAPRFASIDRITYEVQTAGGAGGVGRQGIYQATSETNPYPNALIVDGGEHVVTSTGWKVTTVSVALEPDVLYWGVVLFGTNAPTVRTYPAQEAVWSPIGYEIVSLPTNLDVMFTRTQAYGALPGTFPASPATSFVAAPIRMYMRYST